MLSIKIICLLSCSILCIADTEIVVTNDTEDNTSSDICAKDSGIAKICLQCSLLSFYATPSLETCCSDESAFLLCEACVKDKASCETLMNELETADAFAEHDIDFYDESNGQDSGESEENDYSPIPGSVDKRFGKLFVNRNPKRYGKVFFGKRSDSDTDGGIGEMEKRFGRIFLGRGSYFGKRSDMDKRYGRLFTNSNNYFGKRSQPFEEVGTEYGDEPELEVAKRYGRVYMGSRRNKLFGKRYGRIFFGKRSNDVADKRYGTLHMGKRFGRLFTGRKKYYFGK